MNRKLKHALAFTVLTTMAFSSASQTVSYTYDGSGNRTRREIVMSRKNAPNRAGIYDIHVEDKLSDRDVRIYPNPTRGMLRVDIPDYLPDDYGQIHLYNLSGQTILTTSIHSSSTTLDISARQNGVYILHISLNGKSISWKIIKE